MSAHRVIFKIPVGLCMVRAPSLFLVASMSQSSSRYAHIDSLRAIAALLVVWMHTSEIFVKVAAPGISNSLFGIAHTLDSGVSAWWSSLPSVASSSPAACRGTACRAA
nr:hypothetical protein [Pseudomonas sp. UBA6718]